MASHDYNSEASAGMAISTFLGTVALFFAGLLMSRLQTFDPSLRLPILYLLVATFGFVFSALIYANMTGTGRFAKQKSTQYLQWGNVLSEYLGVYPFIVAIPLSVGAITDDVFLRIATLVLTIVSITLYSASPFSMISRSFDRRSIIWFNLFLCFEIGLIYGLQRTNIIAYQIIGLIFLVGFLALCTVGREKT